MAVPFAIVLYTTEGGRETFRLVGKSQYVAVYHGDCDGEDVIIEVRAS